MFVPVSKPLFDDKEKAYVTDAMEKGEISGFSGSYIKKFEDAFSEFCEVPHAVAVNSGTTALHLAFATLKIGAGDEVLVSTFTNMATFFAVLYQGAKPIPIDIEPDTLNMDPSLLEKYITKKTKAILVVHIYGHPVDMDPVLAIAKKHNLYVIEDAAEAHGATYKGKKVGSLGDIGCFSFYANKIITTGEGGMLTMKNKEWAERARMLKSISFGKENKFMHQDIGYNYRMTNVSAAIGCAQMEKVDEIIKRKRDMAKFYLTALKDVEGIQLPVEKEYAFNVYWMFNIVLTGKLSGKRAQIIAELEKRGVQTREDFIPYNEQDIFIAKGETSPELCPNAAVPSQNGMYIPSGTDISDEELRYVAKQIIEVANTL